METVIRSPQDGIIKKLAHKEGVSSQSTFDYSPGDLLLTWLDRISAKQAQSSYYLRSPKARQRSHEETGTAFEGVALCD